MVSSEHGPIRLTDEPVRRLTAEQLGVKPSESSSTHPEAAFGTISALDDSDPILRAVRDLSRTYGGIIFQGPPGTSKSWYAARVALTLARGDPAHWRPIQFHPSYQYEDFVEGWVPALHGGFDLRPKHFLELCEVAQNAPDATIVLVIDELSRCDPGRVFGEALTYIERTKRGIPFRLASGTECVVPENLLILATLNPLGRGVDEVDAALERRFAKIPFDPDADRLDEFLSTAGMHEALRERVIRFFQSVHERAKHNPYVTLGHTYFLGCKNEDDLRRLWRHQLRFHFDKAFQLNPDEREAVFADWDQVLEVRRESPGKDVGELQGDDI